MDEDVSIINSNTRNEKIKNFFKDNKKILLALLFFLLILVISYFSYSEYKGIQIKKISDRYNSAVIDFSNGSKDKTVEKLLEIIDKKDPTYSTLSLYFIIDNQLISDRKKINDLFDILINKTSLKKNIKNLVIYKKALYNADFVNENEILEMLKPLINNQTIWSSHAFYLLAEFFYSKNEKQKAKEFFNKILSLDNANQDIIKETQKRLNRDFSD